MPLKKLVVAATAAVVAAVLSVPLAGAAVAHPGAASPFVLTSPARAGIGWNFEWDDDDDDWSQTATWECPAGCSITWEDNY